MKRKIFLMCLFFVSMQVMASKPEKCPGVDAIKSIGFNNGVRYWELSDNWNAYAQRGQVYDVPGKWDVYTGSMKAIDESDALRQAKQILNSLYFVKGPFEVLNGTWLACDYQSDLGIPTYAMTPNHGIS